VDRHRESLSDSTLRSDTGTLMSRVHVRQQPCGSRKKPLFSVASAVGIGLALGAKRSFWTGRASGKRPIITIPPKLRDKPGLISKSPSASGGAR